MAVHRFFCGGHQLPGAQHHGHLLHPAVRDGCTLQKALEIQRDPHPARGGVAGGHKGRMDTRQIADIRFHEANADRIAGAALLDMAGANLTVELPAELLAQNAEYQMNQLRQRLRKSQMTMELYCKSAGLTPEQVLEGYRREAERQLRAVLAVRAIAEAEQITVTQQEVDAEYARLSKLHDTPEEEIRKVLSRDAVAAAVTNQKVQRFLLDHAALTSVVEKE